MSPAEVGIVVGWVEEMGVGIVLALSGGDGVRDADRDDLRAIFGLAAL